MEDLVAAIALGIIQGLTEFLPISSTAHLALAERFLRLDPARYGLAFTVALHMGTLVAVLLYFARTWLELVRDVLAGRFALVRLLVVATIPAVVVALLFDDLIAGPLRHPLVIAGALALGSVVFLAAERLGRASTRRGPDPAKGSFPLGAGTADAAAIGLAQAAALLPGLSRSGMTISAGLARGLRRDAATRLSFLLSTPAIFGAGVKTALDASQAESLLARPDALVAGFVASLLVGLGAIAFLVRFLRDHSLAWFVPYRIALAAAIVGAVMAGAL